MSQFYEYYHTMRDGTIKQVNPFTGTEVWTVPGRGDKPITNVISKEVDKIEAKEGKDEDFCNFCSQNVSNTPPEKERVIKENGVYKTIPITSFDELYQSYGHFRRVPNLFEIVSYNYWKENYNYKMPKDVLKKKHQYLSDRKGQEHVLNVINTKLSASGQDFHRYSDEEKLDELSNSFFAGCHELIIAGRHFKENAQYNIDLCSSGELPIEEHYQYLRFTIHTMEDIFKQNRFVRYIAVFQNWLAPAGASFNHLHKQLVGLDEWGTSIERNIKLIRENKNMYNEFGANFAAYNDLIFAENDYALAFADIGHRFPTVAIYSKSVQPFPAKQSEEEVRGISNLVHACHKAMGNQLSCNEEWYYTPYDTIEIIPWHILLKWRLSIPAGFEGGTNIFINPISPEKIRDKIVPKLFGLRDKALISKDIRIAEECKVPKNPLLYYRYSM